MPRIIILVKAGLSQRNNSVLMNITFIQEWYKTVGMKSLKSWDNYKISADINKYYIAVQWPNGKVEFVVYL